jgi:hypothetical protein
MAVKYSKWSQNLTTLSMQGPPNFTKIGIFGLKTNHLATLMCRPCHCGQRSTAEMQMRKKSLNTK